MVALNYAWPDRLKGKIGCDVGLYKTTVIPSLEMGDLAVIVDSPDWHEFGARVIAPRTIAPAELDNTGDGSCRCLIGCVGSTDAHSRKPYDFNSGSNIPAANNGTEINGLDHGEVAAIRFYEVIPNTERRTDPE